MAVSEEIDVSNENGSAVHLKYEKRLKKMENKEQNLEIQKNRYKIRVGSNELKD